MPRDVVSADVLLDDNEMCEVVSLKAVGRPVLNCLFITSPDDSMLSFACVIQFMSRVSLSPRTFSILQSVCTYYHVQFIIFICGAVMCGCIALLLSALFWLHST
jgi:hypothetical protein